MKKWIALGVLALMALVFVLWQSQREEAAGVQILQDGKEIYHFSAKDLKKDRDIEIEGCGGRNVVHVGKDGVYMKFADCPDQICVKSGRLTKDGRPIVCLPHRLVVKGEG